MTAGRLWTSFVSRGWESTCFDSSTKLFSYEWLLRKIKDSKLLPHCNHVFLTQFLAPREPHAYVQAAAKRAWAHSRISLARKRNMLSWICRERAETVT